MIILQFNGFNMLSFVMFVLVRAGVSALKQSVYTCVVISGYWEEFWEWEQYENVTTVPPPNQHQ